MLHYRIMLRFIGLITFTLLVAPVGAVETVFFREDGQQRSASGQVLVEAQDGGLVLQSDSGRIWTIFPDHVVDRRRDEVEFRPIDHDEMERRLRAELPAGFEILRTSHYLIGYNSNQAYARRVAMLLEQLYRGFYTYWRNHRWDLPDPEFPLVALVLDDREDFLAYAGAEVGEAAESFIGYYHLGTNRIITYNVPNFERNVATVIHEATHQLAYNCGLQKRFADNPMWVSEGLAIYFESPDRRNPNSWRGIGQVNRVNLDRWRKYQQNRPPESLETLLADDSRFRRAATAEAAYAECWALTYFLIRTRRQQYIEYLQELSRSRPLVTRSDSERIDMVERAFGLPLSALDQQFVSYMRRVR